MAIDIQRKVLFAHIPKTGGSTIERLLGWDANLDAWVLGRGGNFAQVSKACDGVSPQHITLEQMRRVLTPVFFAECFTFTFVRNPWDRVVSEFCWRNQNTPGRYRDLAHLLEWLDRPFARRWNFRGADGHLEPQVFFLKLDGKLANLDFVGRFERLEADVRELCSRLGVAAPEALPKERESAGRGPYQEYYTTATRQKVAEFYAEDIEAFGYQYE